MSQSMDKRKGEKIRKGIKPPLTAKTELRKEILFQKKLLTLLSRGWYIFPGLTKQFSGTWFFFSTH